MHFLALPALLLFASTAPSDPPAPEVIDASAEPVDATSEDDQRASATADDDRPPEPEPRASTTSPDTTKPQPVIAVPAADARAAKATNDTALVVDGPDDGPDDDDAADDKKAEPKADPRAPKPAGVTFSGIPAINYIADNGLGLGLIAAAYFHDGVTTPYRTAVTLQIFATTNLVQDHNVFVDALRLFDLPLRLNARVGFLSSLTQNYCGVGGTVTCDVRTAEQAAADAGHEGVVDGVASKDAGDSDAFLDFSRRYYQRRFMNPYGLINLRYALIERSAGQPVRVEVTGGYRAFYFIPGNIFADDDGDGSPDFTPYPGSLFEKDHPDGEPGFSSIVNAGLMIDSRDNEPSPTEGWWLEASVRTTTPGSTWTNVGGNVTIRGYTHLPLDAPLYGNLGRRLVLANRLTFDGVVGDVPIQDLARLGGSQEVYAFGGADMGRGIRVQRFMGKAKILDQAELRFRFFEFDFFEQQFALTLAGFFDSAIVADELIAPTDIGVAAGGGGAFRIAWNENFIVRLDVGVSPFENWSPYVYITINQPF